MQKPQAILPLLLHFVLLLAPKLHLKQADYTKFLFGILFIFISGAATAQYKVKGTVYDSSRIYPIEAVSVLSTNGRGTATDSLGHYQLDVSDKDSIWFSYLGKPTPKYPVLKIADVTQFNIALRLKTDVLKEVRIRSHNYKEDSVQNRKEYAKAFNFRKPNFESITSIGPTGAGIDIDELIRLFQFRKNRAALRFQQRLLEQEREKFTDHRFNKALVRRLTGLDGEALTSFMKFYRPAYEFALNASEYDFQLYIKKSGEAYKQSKTF